jgi:hypothetical protein
MLFGMNLRSTTQRCLREETSEHRRFRVRLSMASTDTQDEAQFFAKDSLVVLKGTDPAVVVDGAADRLEVLLLNKKTKKVKCKDAEIVHPGPVRSWEMEELKAERVPDPKKVEAAFDLLSGAGEATTACDLASLLFGEATPAAAWAAWRFAQEDLYFHGRPAELYAYPRNRVNEVAAPPHTRFSRVLPDPP